MLTNIFMAQKQLINHNKLYVSFSDLTKLFKISVLV